MLWLSLLSILSCCGDFTVHSSFFDLSETEKSESFTQNIKYQISVKAGSAIVKARRSSFIKKIYLINHSLRVVGFFIKVNVCDR